MTEPHELSLPAQLLLLVYDDRTAKPLTSSVRLKAALAGAAVVELVLCGALRIDGEGRKARLSMTGQHVPALYADALERADGQSPKNAIARIGGASDWKDRANQLREDVFADLQARGLGQWRTSEMLGITVSRRWVPTDTHVEMRLRQQLNEALHLDGTPDTRDAALIALLDAMSLLPKIFRELDKRFLKERAKAVAETEWGAKAVRDAIRDVEAAVAGSVAGTSAAT